LTRVSQMAHALLIKTITNMVLISIHPFPLRRIFLVIAALLCFSAFCLADPVLMAQRYARRSKHVDPAASVVVPLPAFASHTGHLAVPSLDPSGGAACVMQSPGVIWDQTIFGGEVTAGLSGPLKAWDFPSDDLEAASLPTDIRLR
jgi:hypothetical protein